MSRFGEMCTMQNEMKIRSQLDETKLKLDSSSLYYEVGPTRPRLAPSVRIYNPKLSPPFANALHNRVNGVNIMIFSDSVLCV